MWFTFTTVKNCKKKNVPDPKHFKSNIKYYIT